MHLIAATLRGVVTLLHDIRLRDVMHFRRLVEHFVILLEVLRERLLVWVRTLALHEQAVLLRGIYELVLVDPMIDVPTIPEFCGEDLQM